MLMEHQVIQFWAPPRLFNTLANHVFQSATYRTIVQTNGEWKITWLSRDGKDENSKCDPFVSMPHPWSRYCTHIRKFNIIRLQRRSKHSNTALKPPPRIDTSSLSVQHDNSNPKNSDSCPAARQVGMSQDFLFPNLQEQIPTPRKCHTAKINQPQMHQVQQ